VTEHVDLERALREAGARIQYPPGADLTSRVRNRVSAPRLGPGGWLRLQLTRPAFVFTAAVVAACAFLIVSPGARVAVADLLGIGGVRITIEDEIPAAGADLSLGQRVALSVARERVDFDVLVPERLGPPDEVYLLEAVSRGQVALVYRARDGLPPAVEGSRAGAVITEFQARLQDAVYKKIVEASTEIEGVLVNGEPGFWIEGHPHVVDYVDPSGRAGRLSSRLVGNTLLWNQDGLTVRIESSLSLESSLAIATSLR
jgi:hypothetical protein